MFSHLSQAVGIRYWAEHPAQAPENLRPGFKALSKSSARAEASTSRSGTVFNGDVTGLPQNEESIGACKTRPNIVLGGTNDYRGLLNPLGNFTGWHFSTNGGRSLANEGLLPTVSVLGQPTPSGGDPVDFVAPNCDLYAASLNYNPTDPFHHPTGVGVYKSTPRRLANCPGGDAPSCWTRRVAVAQTPSSDFYDKEWMYVGKSGAAGRVVWVTFSDFVNSDTAPLGYTSASIKAVRCNSALTHCTKPMLISGRDKDVQFSDVTIGPDGRTYITWAHIIGELPGSNGEPSQPQTFVIKMRVAPPGSTHFGPARVVHVEHLPIPFGGLLHANDFRVATYPVSDVAMVRGKPRVFVIWDACRARVLDTVCEEPAIKLSYSDDLGASWTAPRVISAGGDNYFPTINVDRATGKVAAAWYTNRPDRAFHNRQAVEMVTIRAASAGVVDRQVLTRLNETEADPLLGGAFIGDYFEVYAHGGSALVHFNANYRKEPLLGEGFAVNQQDNFLVRTHL